jgi:predicted NBD/HSP70 family sugar kinase
LAERAGAQGHTGLAISFAGWIDADGQGISAGPNLGWGAENLAKLARAHNLSCHLENDLDARAWGEWLSLDSLEQQRGDLMVINAGSGFALGLVVGGQLVRGVHRRAGEIGHLRGGSLMRCGCGTQGCIETQLGGAHLPLDSWEQPGFEAQWIEQATQVLAPVIAALDPAHIIATGGILDHRKALIGRLNQSLIKVLPKAWWGGLELVSSQGGEELARRGVVELAQSAQRG